MKQTMVLKKEKTNKRKIVKSVAKNSVALICLITSSNFGSNIQPRNHLASWAFGLTERSVTLWTSRAPMLLSNITIQKELEVPPRRYYNI